MKFKYVLLSAAVALSFVPAVQAKPFKWTSQGEISTWDIHSQNNALQSGLHANVYESLVYYNSRTFQVEPVLATAWREVSPTQMRFTLREGVKFQSGNPFSAEDVAYTFNVVNGPDAKIATRQPLTRQEASDAFEILMSGEASMAQVGGFLMALRVRGETVDEIAGAVSIMRQKMVPVDAPADAIDIVGTGGDQAGTVNISTMAAIVIAACGIPVMKHGSRSASGKTGSSEMLEALGINLELAPERVIEIAAETGITFFYAPVFHPAMRHAAKVRKELGVPTTFNFLGPLANPVQPIATALGVANPAVAPLMAEVLAQRGRSGMVFRGSDGLDEITVTGDSQIWEVANGEVNEHRIDPRGFGIDLAWASALEGGDADFNARVARNLFSNSKQSNSEVIRDIVALNAAVGIATFELAKDPSRVGVNIMTRISHALERSYRAIDDGLADSKLATWINASNQTN